MSHTIPVAIASKDIRGRMSLLDLKTLSSKKYINTFGNTVAGLVYSVTEHRCIITKSGRTMYVRDVVLTDESMFGFSLKEWVDERSYSKLHVDLMQKEVNSLRRGDIVIFYMVAIKATGKCNRSYGTINVSAESTLARPKLVVYYRSGSILHTPFVIGFDKISCTLLTKNSESRLKKLNSWAKAHHAAIFNIDDDLQKLTPKDSANDSNNSVCKGKNGKRKRDDSSNVVESLEMLKPNRTQTFTALLKEVRPHHKEQYTSSSSIISKNMSNESSYHCLVLIFSDEEHTEVALQCCQPYFQWKSTIEKLLSFRNQVCRVENIFVSQSPFGNKSVSRMRLKTTMQTKIYTLNHHNSYAQNILVNCGRLKPVFQINGYVEELELSDEVLMKLVGTTSGKDIKTTTLEYGTLHIRIDKCGQTSIQTDAPLLSLTPGSNIMKVKVSLERVSKVLLNGVSLEKLFTWKKNSGRYLQIVNGSNGVAFRDDDLKLFLAWQMLSSIMNTQLSTQKDLDGGQRHRICFLVHAGSGVEDTSCTNALPELVDMKLL